MSTLAVGATAVGWTPSPVDAMAVMLRQNARHDQRKAAFRARLRAASHSRAAMATVAMETLASLGYDTTAWDSGQALLGGEAGEATTPKRRRWRTTASAGSGDAMTTMLALDDHPKVGIPFSLGGKVFVVCSKCRKLVRIDKPLLGSLHVCAPQ